MSIKLHSRNSPKAGPFSLKTLSAAVLSAVLCSSAFGAGLGKLTVLSSLGQPLRAEIELTSVGRDEAGSIVAKLASVEAYRQANIEFNPVLFSLRFAIENRGDRHFIRVTSTQPINEPFVDMLLELGGTGSRLVREYTFLLDPADLRTSQSAQVNPAAASQARGVGTGSQEKITRLPPMREASERQPEPARSPRTAPAARSQAAGAAAGTDNYEVRQGDTLARIAHQVKPEGVSLDQMLVALYRANTSAFINNNMNRLRAGQILTVPDADAVRSIGSGEARGVVIAQAADFNSYRNKLAAQAASTAPQQATEAQQSAAGKITTKVEEKPTAVNEAKDKLKLSNAGAGAKAPGSSASGIAPGTEDMIAKDKALAEANSRVKELEKNVSDLQKLLEIKNKDLAEQQKQADLAKQANAAAIAAATAAAATPAPAPAAAAPAPAVPATTPSVTPEVEKPAEASTVPAEPAAAVAEPAAAAPAPEATPPAAGNEQPAAAPEKPAVKAAPPAPEPEPSFIDELLENTVLLASLLAGLLAGLGGLVFYSRRRKQQAQKFDDSLMTDSSLKANSLFGSTGGQSVDTNNSVFNSSFSPAVSQLDTNEVDPVAEADVYIAYGRDAQAEEILKEALRTQPERNAVRLKLLEIYANRKDLRAFETLATELYSMTKGEGEDWEQAAAMGVALDPNNPLYAGGKASASPAAQPAGLMAPTQPLEESELDDLLSTTQAPSTLGNEESLGGDSAYFGNTLVAGDVAPEVPEEKPSTDMLDFDLDGLSTQAPKLPQIAEEPKVVETPAAADLNIGMMDFGLDQAAPADETDAPPTAMNVELGSDDLSFMPASLPAVDEEEKPAATAQNGAAQPMDFDLSDISLDLGSTNKAAEANKDEVASDFALDLPMLGTEDAAPSLEVGNAAPAFDLPQENFDDSLIAETEEEYSPDSEMATKLDLAIAYQEIGDKDGARELLDEVIKGGTPDQSEKARSLLVALA